MMIAQITDLHVRPRGKVAYERVDTNAMLEAAVAAIEALPRKPDLVIATGDLTDCGLAEEYEVLRDILEPLVRCRSISCPATTTAAPSSSPSSARRLPARTTRFLHYTDRRPRRCG